MRPLWQEPILWACFGLLAVIILVMALVIGPAHDEWVAWCESVGGHVLTDHDTGVGVGSNGGTVVTSSTDYWCLSPDGRILERDQ